MTPSAADTELFGEALGLTERLPVRFVADAGSAAPRQAASSSLTLIRLLAMLDEPQRGTADDSERNLADLERLEAKVDLLLALFGESLRKGEDIPPRCDLRWSSLGARFSSVVDSPAVGDRGLLTVHVDPRLPRPIELRATVLAVDAPRADLAVEVYCRFDDPDAVIGADLERHIFRHHRRQIAQTRRVR